MVGGGSSREREIETERRGRYIDLDRDALPVFHPIDPQADRISGCTI